MVVDKNQDTATSTVESVKAGGGQATPIAADVTQSDDVRRMAQPEEIADAVCFLAPDDAGYITGQALSVNGGQSMC